jgi:hypothetical protein
VTPGDTCAQPHEILLVNGVGTAIGDTTGQRDDAAGSCAGTGAPDVVYRFTTPSVGTLTIDIRSTSPGFKPTVYLRSACDTPNAQVTAACGSTVTGGGATSLALHGLPAGTYFLWIDGRDGTAGAFTINMNLLTGTGETCASPLSLAFAGGEANVAGSTANLAADDTGTCGGAGPDTVYRFDVTSPSLLDATLATTTINARPVLYLRTTCTGTEGACGAANAGESSATIRTGVLPVGTYHLWVDNFGAGSFDYALNVRLRPPAAGEICTVAKPLAFSNGQAGGTASDNGDTTAHFHDGASTVAACSSTGPDVVYTFTTSATLSLRASVSTTSSTYRPTLYLRPADCAAGTDQVCNAAALAGGTAILTAQDLPAGTYYLWVDGAAGTSGPYTLSATLDPPLPGESCASVRPLVFTGGTAGGTASTSGDTSPHFDDGIATCGVGAGNDVVYSFTTSATLDFRATLSGVSATYRPVLSLRSGTCTGATSACAIATSAGADTTLAIGRLPAGTYFLWVDGASGTAGAYMLNASLTPPQVGEGCATPKPLVFSGGTAGGTASDAGDTTTFFDDGPAGTCITGTAPDIVYSFTTSAVLNFNATVSALSPAFRPAISLRSACATSQLGCTAAAAAGGSANLSIGSLPAGTYYLWIDGVSGSAGAYTLSASLAPPPQGEVCANPLPLTFNAGGTATATGDTTTFFNDSTGTCSGNGPDVVYSFTTSAVRDLTVTASTTSGTHQPAVYLRSGTCAGTERACGVASVAGGTASLSVNGLAAGTHYLFVDGNTAGPFALSASLVTPPPEEVRPTAISDVQVPGPMVVTFEVVDRYGQVVTSDSSTRFTVNASGSAVFASASQGTIVSGAGTSSVVVTVSSGIIRLNVTDTVAETVTFTAVDSQGNGLRYPGTTFNQTSAVQSMPCSTGGTVRSFTFSVGAARPTGNGTVTVFARGDLDAATEYVDVFMESLAGTNHGQVFATTGFPQCGASYSSGSVTIPLASLQTYASDGQVSVDIRSSTSVNCLCTPEDLYLVLAFPQSVSGTFTP